MRDQQGPVSGRRWQATYGLTLSACCAFTAICLMVYGFGIRSNAINGGIALAFFAVLMLCSIRMLTSRGALGALPYFLIGSGIFYGLGTFIATMLPEAMYGISFTTDVQRQMLSQVNAANVVAISIVVLVAAPICMFTAGETRRSGQEEPGLHAVLAQLERSLPVLLMISVPIVAMMWLTFPGTRDPLLGSLLSMLIGVPLFTALLAGAVWTRLDGGRKALIILLVVAMSLHGLFGLRKLFTILPILSLIMGMWIFPRTRMTAAIVAALVMVVYFGGMAETLGLARIHTAYDPWKNTIFERVYIVFDTFDTLSAFASLQDRGGTAQRFTIAPFEAHFIALYDSGAPGDSLRDFFNVLVPRIFWPDKPIISPGAEFDIIFRGYIAQSSLAIGFIAEAYWNLGWLGIVLISAMIGLQLGWLTRRWHLFCQHGLPYAGIFLMSPLVIKQAIWAETNIVGGHVGGTVKLMLMIVMIDMLVRFYLSWSRNAERMRPANLLARLYG